MRVRRMVALGVTIGCGGCDITHSVVQEPERITLQEALVGTVQALNAAYQEARRPGNVVIGYYPCTMTATYNISAVGTSSHTLSLGVTGGPATGVAVSASGSTAEALTAARGNSIQVVFASSLCLPEGSGGAVPALADKPAHGGRATRAAATTLPPPPQVFAVPPPAGPLMLLPPR